MALSKVLPANAAPRLISSTPSRALKKTAPLGLGSDCGSLSKAAQPDPLRRLLELNLFFEDLGKTETELFEEKAFKIQDRQREISAKQKQLVEKKAQTAESLKTWSAVSSVAAYGSLAAGVVIGASIATTAPVAATILIASGACGITGRIMGDLKGWRWVVSRFTDDPEKIKKYSSHLETALTTASSAAALAGGFASGAVNLAGRLLPAIVLSTASVVNTVASAGKDLSTRAVLKTEAELKQAEQEKTGLFSGFTLQNETLKSLVLFQKNSQKSLSSLIELNLIDFYV